MMDRRTFVAIVGGALLGLSPNLRAQGQATARRIGFLSAFAPLPRSRHFSVSCDLSWKSSGGPTVGTSCCWSRERRRAERRLPSLAAELVAQRPDLILVQTVPATRALMQATKSIPIVMIGVGNPVELGIVADYRKPGGNVTGSSYLADESTRKLLQLLKEAAPRLRSVAVFVNPSNEAAAALVKQMRADAVAFGMQAADSRGFGPGRF